MLGSVLQGMSKTQGGIQRKKPNFFMSRREKIGCSEPGVLYEKKLWGGQDQSPGIKKKNPIEKQKTKETPKSAAGGVCLRVFIIRKNRGACPWRGQRSGGNPWFPGITKGSESPDSPRHEQFKSADEKRDGQYLTHGVGFQWEKEGKKSFGVGSRKPSQNLNNKRDLE